MNKIANSSPPIGIINDFECNTPILYRTHLKMITLDLLIDNQLKVFNYNNIILRV